MNEIAEKTDQKFEEEELRNKKRKMLRLRLNVLGLKVIQCSNVDRPCLKYFRSEVRICSLKAGHNM